MHAQTLLAFMGFLSIALGAPTVDNVETSGLAARGLENLLAYSEKNLDYGISQCTPSNTFVRKEWTTLSADENRAYIEATSLPASAYNTASFFAWHRHYVHSFEQVLRNECGYNGTQPYWDWAITAADPLSAQMFDGSDTSMSGNGEPVDLPPINIPGPSNPLIEIPPTGTGGGCVTTGPFANWSVNLGPVSPTIPSITTNPQVNGLDYNPRCLRRDINGYISSTWNNDAAIAAVITNYTTFATFANRFQGDFPGGDIYASPGEPIFFLNHAQVDRVWWIWQNLDLENRQFAYEGPLVMNDPSSGNGTLDDVLSSGVGEVNGRDVTAREAMSTLAGPFCYVYA